MLSEKLGEKKLVTRSNYSILKQFLVTPSMRILILHWKDITHPYAGGAENIIHKLAKELALKHEVILFCGGYTNSKEVELIDRVRIVRGGSSISVYLLATLFYLKNRKKIDVVIDSITGIPWFTPLYCWKRKIAVIYHLGRKETFFTELPAMWGLKGYFLALLAWMAESSIGWLYKATPFITFSECTKDDLSKLGIPKTHIFVAQEGIDLTKYGLGEKDCFPHVIYVGRLVKNKGVEFLIKAMKTVVQRVPNAKLSIIGRGYFEVELKKLVRELKLEDYVIFHGYVPEREKITLLQRAYVLVMPSLREGWATPVIEAGACGTPAIGTDTIGVRDTIIEGVTGLLFSYGGVDELAEKLILVLTNHDLRCKLSEGAFKYAKNFDWRTTVKKFTKAFDIIVYHAL
jgi:glycosyltransferase involved in cell wall biosynthesis